MDVPKVAARQVVEQLAAILDSPEVARMISTMGYLRETGRIGYGARAMIPMCFVKTLYALPTWSRVCRLVAEHEALQRVIGAVPSQWACYRFAKQLRTRDQDVLGFCIHDVLQALRAEHPDMGKTVAVDASDLPAYAVGHGVDKGERKATDPHASWGHRSAVSTRGAGGFYGYKVHAAVDTVTGLPLAWEIHPANTAEQVPAINVIDRVINRGFKIDTAIMDKGYDAGLMHALCMHRNIAPVIAMREVPEGRRGKSEPPHCVHGDWTFAGADYKRKATKWRCPTGECQPGSMWLKADRLHPLIPRDSKRFKDLYRQRGSVEREFGRLKHEWSLLPLRVRGIGRVRLHADLTILAKLACALDRSRTQTAPLAA